MSRVNFYLFLAALVVLDAVLLRSPNLLGKIGLIIYKYHYLRTFPKALITVALVVGMACVLAEAIRFMVKKDILRRVTARVVLGVLSCGAVAMLVKTGLDFTTWSYSHTGLRFKIGAHLLPAILVVVFVYAFVTLPRRSEPFPLSPAVDEEPSQPDNA